MNGLTFPLILLVLHPKERELLQMPKKHHSSLELTDYGKKSKEY